MGSTTSKIPDPLSSTKEHLKSKIKEKERKLKNLKSKETQILQTVSELSTSLNSAGVHVSELQQNVSSL
jgi:chromosome segregation ATPase